MASPLRHCALRPPRSSRPDYRHAPRIHKGTVEYVTFPTGRITGLQSADCIEMIEIQDGGERSRLVYGSRAAQSHVSTRATSQARQDSGPHLTESIGPLERLPRPVMIDIVVIVELFDIERLHARPPLLLLLLMLPFLLLL